LLIWRLKAQLKYTDDDSGPFIAA